MHNCPHCGGKLPAGPAGYKSGPPRTQANGNNARPWAKPLASLAYFELTDASGWLRITHTNGTQYLVPHPYFEGWDEAFPPRVGAPSADIAGYQLDDVLRAIEYLTKLTRWKVIGDWRQVRDAIRKRALYLEDLH